MRPRPLGRVVRRRDAGFTLLETLVAVTLLALLLGALMPVFQQGLEVLRRGDHHTRAVLLAQSLLERESLAPEAARGLDAGREGRDGDYRWAVERAPYDPAEDGGPVIAEGGALGLVRATVTVTWPGNEAGVRISTLVLEPSS